MIYGKMPMMIFLLASGYLLTVYLLLAMAKRTGKRTALTEVSLAGKEKHEREISVPKIT
jgi:hypothetical protein